MESRKSKSTRARKPRASDQTEPLPVHSAKRRPLSASASTKVLYQLSEAISGVIVARAALDQYEDQPAPMLQLGHIGLSLDVTCRALQQAYNAIDTAIEEAAK